MGTRRLALLPNRAAIWVHVAANVLKLKHIGKVFGQECARIEKSCKHRKILQFLGVERLLFKKNVFFLNGLEKNSRFFRKKTLFFWKSWKNLSRVAHNVKKFVLSGA